MAGNEGFAERLFDEQRDLFGASAPGASLGDAVLERVVADRAVHHLVADDEQGGTGRSELASELHVAVELGIDVTVLLRSRGDVGALSRCGDGVGRGATRSPQCIVELGEPSELGSLERKAGEKS